jgi:uncharacterized SAM-binding protein YcdF (DUF218 family)
VYPTYTEPLLTLFLLAGWAGGIAVWRRCGRRLGLLVLAANTGLFLSCWMPAAWLFSRPLELPYGRLPRYDRAVRDRAGAIVVLAANVDPARLHFPIALPDRDTYARCRYAAWLYSSWRTLPVFVSGGNRSAGQPSFADAMAHVLKSEGVPASDIVLDDRSLNTWENAVFTAELLRQRNITRIVLVVDALSMMRAERCFRSQGIEVIPAPILQVSVSMTARDLIPSWRALRLNEVALHEIVGLAWYKLQNRI